MKKNGIILGVVLILSGLSYLPGVKGDFLGDEYLLISENPLVRNPEGFSKFFLSKFWPQKAKDIYYRPLVILSYAWNWRLGRANPLGYHLFNLGFHLLNTLLFYFLFRRWFPESVLLASALFALHPVLTEAVAKISGRTDLLATFFLFLGWLLWEKAEGKAGWRKFVIYITAGLCGLLSLFSKESGILLPLFLLLRDFWSRTDGLIRRLRSHLFGYLMIAGALAIYFGLRHQALTSVSGETEMAFFTGFSFWEKVLTMSRIWFEYLRLEVFPYPLNPDYFYLHKFAREKYPIGFCIISFFFWLWALVFLFWRFFRRKPLGLLGLLWICALLPVSHLVPIPPAMAERFLYLPTAFFALAFALLLYALAKPYLRIVAVSMSAVLVSFFILTCSGTRIYQDWYFILRAYIKKVPEERDFHNTLGVDYLEMRLYPQAKRQFLWSFQINPEDPETLTYLGLLEYATGNNNSALNLFQNAIQINPKFAPAHYNLGRLLTRLGELESAKKALIQAQELDPQNPAPIFAQAGIALKQNDFMLAKKLLDSALQLSSSHLPSLKLRAMIAISEKDYGYAKELIQRVEKISPKDPELARLRSYLPL